jgi:cell division protein FtsW (lipid II flippase)
MRHTDFVYSVVGEEWGLMGALTVVILYAVVILRGFRVGAMARNGFASLWRSAWSPRSSTTSWSTC